MYGPGYNCGCGRKHAPWWGLHVQAPSCSLTHAERVLDVFLSLMKALERMPT